MKKYSKKIGALVAGALVFLSLHGCATLVGDNTRTLCVHSQPQGAGVYVDGQRLGTTPTTITIPHYIYGGKSVVVKKEGYHEQTKFINTLFQPCSLWDILFWPGFVIDGACGNMVKIDPSQLNLYVDLQPVESSKDVAEVIKTSN